MRVLDAFPWVEARFAGVREDRGGEYVTAACPFAGHERPGGKLRLWVRDGRLCFTCWGGCDKLEILRAVGAGWKDCFPGDVPDRPRQEVAARYRYRDEGGVLLYETVRLYPGFNGRDKDFRQRRPAGPGDPSDKVRGGWVWGLSGVRRVLYRLPELLAAAPNRTVLVVAGEKDADSLARVGVEATTNVCGERAEWLDEYSTVLAGRPVVVVQDADAAGRRHANEVVGSLLDHGAAAVRRVRLPDKDATAFLGRLRAEGVGDPAELRRALWDAVRAAPDWRPAVRVG